MDDYVFSVRAACFNSSLKDLWWEIGHTQAYRSRVRALPSRPRPPRSRLLTFAATISLCMAAVTRIQAVPPPSQFASLLRRSKFASYDPQIGQVYASYDGDAHRGNWGLKRPLPLRRRTAHITISAIDSKEQQTEWRHADNDVRWIKMWDEVGVHPRNADNTAWTTRLGGAGLTQHAFDSEFAQELPVQPIAAEAQAAAGEGPLEGYEAAKEDDGEEAKAKAEVRRAAPRSSRAIPNIEAMSNKQFDVYLKRMRRLHPEFAEYVREVVARDPNKGSTLWELVTTDKLENHHSKFLGHQAYKLYNAPDSRAIEQQPAKAAGLSYTKTSGLQSILDKKPRKGRLLANGLAGQERTVGFAGTNASLPFEYRGPGSPLHWAMLATNGTYNPTAAVSEYRYHSAELEDAPTVVGSERKGLDGLRLKGNVVDTANSSISFGRLNPHTPGSREYVGFVRAAPAPANVLDRVRSKPASDTVAKQSNVKNLLSTLEGLIESIPPRSE